MTCNYRPCSGGWVEFVLRFSDGMIYRREIAECPYWVLHEGK